MYLSTRSVPETEHANEPVARRARTRVAPTVVFLGLTSMFTDISSEMVSSVLPVYLTATLGFSPLQFGFVDGLLPVIAAALAMATAIASDRRMRHKRLATTGYAVSAGSRLGMLLAAGSWAPTVGLLYVDRVAKGIRTAPRDALISLSSRRADLGRAFGVHRSLDAAGALIGPVVAAFVLARSAGSYRGLFVTSFCVACIGVAIIVLFVREPRAAETPTPTPATETTATETSTRSRFRIDATMAKVLVAAFVLAACNPGDGLIYLSFTGDDVASASTFPLLYVGTAAVFLLFAIPAGRACDRYGTRPVLLAGIGLLAGTFAVIGLPMSGPLRVILLFAAFGGAYAATDPVLAARMSRAVPPQSRAFGMALLAIALAVAHFVSALLFSTLWQSFGTGTAAAVYIVGLGLAAIGLFVLAPRRKVQP